MVFPDSPVRIVLHSLCYFENITNCRSLSIITSDWITCKSTCPIELFSTETRAFYRFYSTYNNSKFNSDNDFLPYIWVSVLVQLIIATNTAIMMPARYGFFVARYSFLETTAATARITITG